MASFTSAFRQSTTVSAQRLPFSDKLHRLNPSSSSSSLSSFKPPLLRNLPLLQIQESCRRITDAFVDLAFEFVDEPLLESQRNFAPVEEIGEPANASVVEGRIPHDFPEGVYIRNGSNPLFGGFKSAKSVFGKTSSVWIEGEGMVHALYLKKDGEGNWTSVYRNRYVETETYKLEKERNRPSFLPAVEGDPPAVIASFLLNLLRFGIPNEQMSNTSIIEHAGRFYSAAENFVPQEIDITSLETLGNWDVGGAWTRPFTSHPKRAPETGELVTIGNDAQKPYCVVGVISADGKKLIHQVDLGFKWSTLTHEVGVTKRYNVIMDLPLVVDLNRVVKGGSLIKYEEEGYSRIGVMPRYGNANSMKWFGVEACCAFHLINCFEDGDEVVVMGCRAGESVIPGPDLGKNKHEWFSRGLKHIDHHLGQGSEQDGKLFTRVYEWRLNMESGDVREGYLTGTQFAMDFPIIHPHFVGLRNKYAYTQLVDSESSSASGMVKYGGLAKVHIEERSGGFSRIEHHMFPSNTFCSGASFVAKNGGEEEDDGWIICFVHNEEIGISQVYIVDAKEFSSGPIAKIELPTRVPYGFHGLFIPQSK